MSVPRGVLVRRAPGVEIRQTRRLVLDDLAPTGVPRTRPEVAGIRAALWAASDKQATLLLTMAVQQGLTTPERLGGQAMTVLRDRRRMLITAVIADLLGGVRSLGEHEFATLCRRHGVPEPTRQAVRRGPGGRWYLDVCWEPWGVVVEIDGIQHEWAVNVVADALRHNALALERPRAPPAAARAPGGPGGLLRAGRCGAREPGLPACVMRMSGPARTFS